MEGYVLPKGAKLLPVSYEKVEMDEEAEKEFASFCPTEQEMKEFEEKK